MDSKQAHTIQQHLNKIQNKTFDESDIKVFLIDVRETLSNSTLREICDSVAHSSRDKGALRDKINNDYWVLKHAQLKGLTQPSTTFQVNILDRDEFNTVLNSVGLLAPNRVTQVFGLGVTAEILQQKVKQCYQGKGGQKILISDKRSMDFMHKISALCLSIIDTTKCIKDTHIIEDITTAIISLMQRYPSIDFELNYIEENQTDIILCILGFLHSVKFKLYDGGEASFCVGVNSEDERITMNGHLDNLNQFSAGFSIPLISTSIHQSQLNLVGQSREQWAPFHACRDESGRLELRVIN